jgi:cytochrome P450
MSLFHLFSMHPELNSAFSSAGSETTAAAMAWWMLAMTMYPEVQRKAQEEIDDVVGRDRMPTIADLDSMPYIRAMVRETLRWRPVDPMGLQHQTSEDDEYNGYFIPKGTLVIYNVWSMHRDTSVYGQDVDEFNPERYLTADGTQLKPVHPATKGEGQVSYGFGRRICVGRYVANNTLFADIAQILWACTISPAKNPDGTTMTYDKNAYINEGLVV